MAEYKFTDQREPYPPGDIVCGLVAYRNDARTFEIFTRIGEGSYDIEADRILLSHRAFTDWIWQLQGKVWMSGQHLFDLLTCLSELIYRDFDQGPQEYFDVMGGIQQDPDR